MKSRAQAKQIRNMSVDELQRQEASLNEQLFRLRFQWAMGQTESLKKMREVRKDRARVLTIIREKEGGN